MHRMTLEPVPFHTESLVTQLLLPPSSLSPTELKADAADHAYPSAGGPRLPPSSGPIASAGLTDGDTVASSSSLTAPASSRAVATPLAVLNMASCAENERRRRLWTDLHLLGGNESAHCQ